MLRGINSRPTSITLTGTHVTISDKFIKSELRIVELVLILPPPQLQELPLKLGGDRLAGILLHRDAGAVLLDHLNDDNDIYR